MRLTELEPQISGAGILTFWCPNCKNTEAHKIRVPLAPAVTNGNSWQHSGQSVENLTLHPSVDAGCFHGYITNGDITPA